MQAVTNPELIRNARAQLRTDRMLITATICAVLSVAVGFAMASGARGLSEPDRWGLQFLSAVVGAQVAVLLIVGGLASVHAIQREKDRNTFDFQRVTRLTPLELALGKLLGAPMLAYFIVLCLLPAALVGAVVGRAHPSFVLAGFVVVVLGAMSFHALALLISLLVERDAAATIVVLVILLLGAYSSIGSHAILNLGSLSPFFAAALVSQTTWAVDTSVAQDAVRIPFASMTDAFFGRPVHHVFVLVVLYVIFTGWFLLAVVRNIKRDPAVYEVYTPAQALGFAFYVNLILVGFFRWGDIPPLPAQGVMLGLNTMLFFALGLALLRNRDRVRRMRQRIAAGAGWISAIWPAPYTIAGVCLVGGVVVGILLASRNPDADWDLGLALFRVGLTAAWIARDVLFLQWMNLQSRHRPLLLGILYLLVFYTCASITLATLGLFSTPRGLAQAGLFVPATMFALDPSSWTAERMLWSVGLLIQVMAGGLFASLHRRELRELSRRAGAEDVAA